VRGSRTNTKPTAYLYALTIYEVTRNMPNLRLVTAHKPFMFPDTQRSHASEPSLVDDCQTYDPAEPACLVQALLFRYPIRIKQLPYDLLNV
jgi:hypothetical protein